MGKDRYNPYRKPPIIRPKPIPQIVREVVPRKVWGAVATAGTLDLTNLPVENVIFTWNTDTEPCQDQESCERTVRELQRRDLDRGLPDIKYNFVVGGDLKVYEGRGWNYKPETHEKFPKLRDNSVEFAFIGDYKNADLNDEPISDMFLETMYIIRNGIRDKNVMDGFWIRENSPVIRIETMGEDERPWEEVKPRDFYASTQTNDPMAYPVAATLPPEMKIPSAFNFED